MEIETVSEPTKVMVPAFDNVSVMVKFFPAKVKLAPLAKYIAAEVSSITDIVPISGWRIINPASKPTMARLGRKP